MRGSAQRGAAIERGVIALLWGLPLLLLLLRCGSSDELPFVVQSDAAPWIAAPAPVSAQLQQWGELEAPVVTFLHRASLPEAAQGRLTLCALGSISVRFDGAELARADASGRGPVEAQLDLAGLGAGAHELEVEVRNALGPALLSVRGDGGAAAFSTGTGWSVRGSDGSMAVAVLADDTRTDPRALAVESPGAALAGRADALLLLATLGGLAFLLCRRAGGVAGWLALGSPVLASFAWLYLSFAQALRIPSSVGFDARHHLEYVELILERGSLPLAAEGWSTYHPPLFYLLSAALAKLGGGEAALKLLPMLAGMGTIWVAWWLARRLRPGEPEVSALAALFAASLPVSLYTAAYFSNEALHALLAGAALVATVDCLLCEGLPKHKLVIAALLFGLAALTKFTVLVTVPVAAFFLGWKLLRVEGGGAGRALTAVAAFAGIVLAVAGWFYLRNVLHYGTPVVGNWALPGEGQLWWQQPGFHTPAWYAAFGEALLHPFYSGFHSFWDGLYSTFWGDAFVAGRAGPTLRHDFWDYGFMAAGYWLALPATGLLLLGAGLLLREAFAAASQRRRLALLFLATAGWAVFLAFASLTAELPFFTQVKAAYLLVLCAPLALCFAMGFTRADAWLEARGWLPAQVLLYAWLAAHAGTVWLTYAG